MPVATGCHGAGSLHARWPEIRRFGTTSTNLLLAQRRAASTVGAGRIKRHSGEPLNKSPNIQDRFGVCRSARTFLAQAPQSLRTPFGLGAACGIAGWKGCLLSQGILPEQVGISSSTVWRSRPSASTSPTPFPVNFRIRRLSGVDRRLGIESISNHATGRPGPMICRFASTRVRPSFQENA